MDQISFDKIRQKLECVLYFTKESMVSKNETNLKRGKSTDLLDLLPNFSYTTKFLHFTHVVHMISV